MTYSILIILVDGHYLNLPVLDEDKSIVGLIDVLRLTYATLEQINSIEGNAGGKFWNSITAGDTESVISDSPSQAANSHMFSASSPTSLPGHTQTYTGLYDTITPGDSASHNSDNHSTLSSLNSGNSFSFKFNYGNKTHRFRHDIHNYRGLLEVIKQKIMVEHLNISQSYVAVGDDWLTVAYLDDEDDQVLMTSDSDLNDAVQLARKSGMDRVRLFVHDQQHELLENSNHIMTKVPPSQPTVNTLADIQEETEPEQQPVRKKKRRDVAEEYNLPIKQDLLLPAAITFLGVAILGIFTFSKLTTTSRY